MIRKTVLAFLVACAIGLVSGAAVFTLVGPERVWSAFFGPADLGPTDFTHIRPAKTPNRFLVCPENYCAAQPDLVATTYPVEAADLKQTLRDIITDMPGTLVVPGPAPDDIRFVQRTPMLRFPDTVSVRVIDTQGQPGSTLAIYSRSQIGRSDLGVNRKRVTNLLDSLQERIASTGATISGN